MSGTINIKNMDKAEVLAKLYNSSKVQGMGAFHAKPRKMTIAEAKHLLDAGTTHFDYLHGKIMKINLKGDTLVPWLYDRDNGEGAAARALGV